MDIFTTGVLARVVAELPAPQPFILNSFFTVFYESGQAGAGGNPLGDAALASHEASGSGQPESAKCLRENPA